jgi:hypothetical protein
MNRQATSIEVMGGYLSRPLKAWWIGSGGGSGLSG